MGHPGFSVSLRIALSQEGRGGILRKTRTRPPVWLSTGGIRLLPAGVLGLGGPTVLINFNEQREQLVR